MAMRRGVRQRVCEAKQNMGGRLKSPNPALFGICSGMNLGMNRKSIGLGWVRSRRRGVGPAQPGTSTPRKRVWDLDSLYDVVIRYTLSFIAVLVELHAYVEFVEFIDRPSFPFAGKASSSSTYISSRGESRPGQARPTDAVTVADRQRKTGAKPVPGADRPWM